MEGRWGFLQVGKCGSEVRSASKCQNWSLNLHLSPKCAFCCSALINTKPYIWVNLFIQQII